MNSIAQCHNVAIVGKVGVRKIDLQIITQAVDFFRQAGWTVRLDRATCHDIASLTGYGDLSYEDTQEIASKSDLAVIIGGDGSLLHAAKYFVNDAVPLIGINMGRLGFLTDIPADRMLTVLEQIINNRYCLEERLMLSVEIMRDGKQVYSQLALNEFHISKKSFSSMIEFETSIDNRFLQSQRSDGMLVSTATGSTAYALSAGGPILDPAVECLSLVSINPHSMTYRPIVVSANATIEIRGSVDKTDYADVLCDGRTPFQLNGRDCITIKRHDKKLMLVHPEDYDHFKILRTKLFWSNKL